MRFRLATAEQPDMGIHHLADHAARAAAADVEADGELVLPSQSG
jgi:hypothetical protein